MKRLCKSRMITVTVTSIGLAAATLVGCGSPATSVTTTPAMQAGQGAPASAIGTPPESHGLPPAPTLGVIVDQTGRVIAFEAGSAAQQAGVQKGDVLVTLDGVQVGPALSAASVGREMRSDHAQLNALRDKVANGKKMNVVVQRGGKPVTIDVTPGQRPAQPNQPTPTAVPFEQLYL